MTPNTDDILLNNIEEVTEQTSKTFPYFAVYRYDFGHGSGYCAALLVFE